MNTIFPSCERETKKIKINKVYLIYPFSVDCVVSSDLMETSDGWRRVDLTLE